MKNFNVPLPDQTYADLLADAERVHVPATRLAYEAINFWLSGQAVKVRHEAIVAYALEIAGTNLDLDPEPEAAGIDHLRKAVP
jgi:hypothetical protein